MAIMDENTRNQVLEAMKEMDGSVFIQVFTSKDGCELCSDTIAIVDELADLSDKVETEHLDIDDPGELAKKYGIDKVPAIVVHKGTRESHEYQGIRFFGIPAGYEFTSLLDSILTTSSGTPTVSEEAMEYLKTLDTDIHIQVFVTPTCPYCPKAVILGHHLAMVSDRITSDMVEASEFQELSQKYNVMGVPRTIINDKHHQEGAAPERMIMDLIKKAAQE